MSASGPSGPLVIITLFIPYSLANGISCSVIGPVSVPVRGGFGFGVNVNWR